MSETVASPPKRLVLVTPKSFWEQLGISRSSLHRLLQNDPRAPRPIPLNDRSIRFLQQEIDRYVLALAETRDRLPKHIDAR